MRQLEEILADAYLHNSLGKTGACEINESYLCGTPLHLFAARGDFEACKVLLDSGALLDIRDGDGFTQLHAAAQQGHLEVVKLLLERGSDPRLSTPMFTMFELVEDYPEVFQAIREAEQGVAPQPATRPELDSEGGEKPQAEAEARAQ